jgi:hypothetical protein
MAVNDAKAFQKFLNKPPLYLALWGWIEALRANGIGVSVEKAILNFMSKNGLTDDDLDLDAAKAAYYRMQEDLRKAQQG